MYGKWLIFWIFSHPDSRLGNGGVQKSEGPLLYITFLDETSIQWNLTYPDTSVPKLTLPLTEYSGKWVTFFIYVHIWFPNICPDKWIILISGVRISEASLYLHIFIYFCSYQICRMEVCLMVSGFGSVILRRGLKELRTVWFVSLYCTAPITSCLVFSVKLARKSSTLCAWYVSKLQNVNYILNR